MRVFIITMDDPVYTHGFIRDIVRARRDSIVGLAVASGDRLTIGKKRSKIVYLASLLLIMGPMAFLRFSFIEVAFKIRKALAKWIKPIQSPSIASYAKEAGIPVMTVRNPNAKSFVAKLKEFEPDVVINQSQCIIRKPLLEVPKIGVINRHNALLPKNRGRLTPFWVLFRREPETGVSIHFVEEGIDSGDIIVQRRFAVAHSDTFAGLVKKNYEHATPAMLEALDRLERGEVDLIPNEDECATYNTVPTFKEALQYRLGRMTKL